MINYSARNIKGREVKEIANSTGLSVIHTHGYDPMRIVDLFCALGNVQVIKTQGKRPVDIKAAVIEQYGKDATVLIDCYDQFPERAFLESAAEKIPASLVCINRRY